MFAIFQAYNENKQMQKDMHVQYDVQTEGFQIKTMLQMCLKILFLL
jgi:hypothetical protein